MFRMGTLHLVLISAISANSPQQAKNVQICMSELLQHIIDESSQLPQEIVDIVLAQFLHKHKVKTRIGMYCIRISIEEFYPHCL